MLSFFLNTVIHFFLFVAGPVYLELYLENIMCKNVSSSVMISNELNVNSIKIFALNDSQQAFILSGPENYDGKFVYTYTLYINNMCKRKFEKSRLIKSLYF